MPKKVDMSFVGILLSSAPALRAAEPEEVGIALLLAVYCAERMNGGRIKNAASFTEREWALAGLPFLNARSGCAGLWHWDGDDIAVDIYSPALEARKRQAQEKAKKAAIKRWGKTPTEDSSAVSADAPCITCSNAPSSATRACARDKELYFTDSKIELTSENSLTSTSSESSQKTRACETETEPAAADGALTRAAAQRVPASEEEVARFLRNAPGILLPPDQLDTCAGHFFLEMEAVGWRFKGNAVSNWRALLTSYAARWAQNARRKAPTPSHRTSTNDPSYYGPR